MDQGSCEVSVIIPNLNSEIIDRVCLALLNQTISKRYEIICVGMDSHGKIPNHAMIKRIDVEKPVPPALARNLGVELAEGKLIIFVDADCIVSADFIENHLKAHSEYTRALIGGSVEFPQDGYLQLSDNISTFHEYMSHRPEGPRRVLPSLNMSLERSDWILLGGFNTHYPLPSGEDSDFVERARSSGINVVFYPSAKVLHCHSRRKIHQVLNHAKNFGCYSNVFRTNKFLNLIKKWSFLFYLFSPFLAMGVVFKIVFLERLPLKYYKTLPILYLSKLAWCYGAARNRI